MAANHINSGGNGSRARRGKESSIRSSGPKQTQPQVVDHPLSEHYRIMNELALDITQGLGADLNALGAYARNMTDPNTDSHFAETEVSMSVILDSLQEQSDRLVRLIQIHRRMETANGVRRAYEGDNRTLLQIASAALNREIDPHPSEFEL